MRNSKLIQTGLIAAASVMLFAGTASAQQSGFSWDPPRRRSTSVQATFQNLTRTTVSRDLRTGVAAYRTVVTITRDGSFSATGQTPAGSNLRVNGRVPADLLVTLHQSLTRHDAMPTAFRTATRGPRPGAFRLEVDEPWRSGRITRIDGGHDWAGVGADKLDRIMNVIDAIVLRCVPAPSGGSVEGTVAAIANTAWVITPNQHFQAPPFDAGTNQLFQHVGRPATANGAIKAHGAWFPFSGDIAVTSVTGAPREGTLTGTIKADNRGGLLLAGDLGNTIALRGNRAMESLLPKLVGRRVDVHGMLHEDGRGQLTGMVADAVAVIAARGTGLRQDTRRVPNDVGGRIQVSDNFAIEFNLGGRGTRRPTPARIARRGDRMWVTGAPRDVGNDSDVRVILPGENSEWFVDVDDLNFNSQQPVQRRPARRARGLIRELEGAVEGEGFRFEIRIGGRR